MNLNSSRLQCWSRIAGFAALAPALLLVTAGLLHLFGLRLANDWLESALKAWPGRIVFSPVTVLGGVLFAVAMNLAFICRCWPSWDEDYLALTVSVRREGARLFQLGLAVALLGCLLAYAFVENFRIVAR
jgi:hypothetical protein